jgi:hypothetical protein
MVRRLVPNFRRGWGNLWKALLTRDTALGVESVRALNLEDADLDALSLMLTFRPAEGSTALGSRLSAPEHERVVKKYKNVTGSDVNAFLQRLPRDFLFVSRNSTIVRSINLSLGGTSRDRFRANGRALIHGLALTAALGEPAAALGSPPSGPSGGAASIVVDMADTRAGEGEGLFSQLIVALTSSLVRRGPPRVPLTYLTVLRDEASHEIPTESEILMSHRVRGARVLSLPQRAAAALDIFALELRLWWADAVLGLAQFFAGKEPERPPRRGTATAFG